MSTAPRTMNRLDALVWRWPFHAALYTFPLQIMLTVTGLDLHRPRNGARLGRQLGLCIAARGRAFWKSLHGAMGPWVGLWPVVFLISGLSWAGIWGGKFVQAWSTIPAEKWDAAPLSGSLAGTQAITGPVTVESVAAFAGGLGFRHRYELNPVAGPDSVWTISHDAMSNDGPIPAADRTIHIDRHSGIVLTDARYADNSPYARAMARGVAFHEADPGLRNLAFNTAFCLSVILLSVSGLVMWWMRRPTGARLGAPPRGQPLCLGRDLRRAGAVAAFPVLGLVLLATLVLSAIPPLKRLVS